MRPGFPGVGGFVDAVAHRKVGAMQAFAAGDVNEVWIRWSYCDGADRLCRLMIEDRSPDAAVVVGPPDSAVDLAHVENIGLAWDAGGGAGAASAKVSDDRPIQTRQPVAWTLRRV